MAKINEKQQKILEILGKNPNITATYLAELSSSSKATLHRNLTALIDLGLVQTIGQGKSTKYKLSSSYELIQTIQPEEYFSEEPDFRKIKKNFNFEIFTELKNIERKIFSDHEKNLLEKLNQEYQTNIKKLPQTIIQKEIERLTIELSWKSSKIEGNTYSLIETENLLKNNQVALGHNQEEASMLLNHKYALKHIFENAHEYKTLHKKNILELHDLISKDLNIKKFFRAHPVGITGTAYIPLDNQFQIEEAIEKASELINSIDFPLSAAIISSLLIAYIQAFEDANKRTSRILANAVLLAKNYCPLSYRSINEDEYKKALILFYEQNNIPYFKELFVEQFEFAVKNYFRA